MSRQSVYPVKIISLQHLPSHLIYCSAESSDGFVTFNFEDESASTSKDVDPSVVSFLTQPSGSGNGHSVSSPVLEELLGTQRSKEFAKATSKPR